MLIRCFACLILLLPIAAFSQASLAPEIRNEEDLVHALLSRPTGAITPSKILRDHNALVTETLFDKLMSQGDDVSNQDPSKALLIYEVAKEAAHQNGDKKLLAYSFYKTGLLHFRQGNITQAKQNYLQSKQILDQLGQPGDLVVVLSGLANVCLFQDALKDAKDYSHQSIALANSLVENDQPRIGPIKYGIAVSWSNLGDLAKGEGHYDEGLTYFQKALESFKTLSSTLPQYKADVADALAEIGRVYRVKGDHLRALDYLNQALVVAQTLSSQDKLAGVLNSIGVLYIEQNDYVKASDFIGRSLSIHRKTGDRFEVARLLLNQGVINQRQAKYDEALKSFRESLDNGNQADAPDLIVAAQEGIGAVYQEQGDGKSALEWFDKAMATAEKLGNKTRQAELLWRSGEAYYLKGDLSKAITSGGNAADLAAHLRLPIISYLALTAKGKYYLAQNNYDSAFQTLSKAVEQIESLRLQVAGQQQGRQMFFENKVASYNLLVELFIKQNKTAEALLYAERAKGRVLLDVLRDGKPDVSRTLTPEEKAELQRLNRNISEVNGRIREEQAKNHLDAALLNRLYVKLDGARVEYDSFRNALYVAHPDLDIKQGRTTALTLEEINSLTRDRGTAYLEYVVTKNQVFLFVLSRGEINAYPIAIKPDQLSEKVNQFHAALAERRPAYASAARELYALLIEPAEQQLRGIGTTCIVPDGFLWNLPFQALMNGNDHFFIEDHAVYYSPSLTVLREMNQTKIAGEKLNSSLIAFGNPVIGKDEQRDADLCPLPEAEIEVSSVAKSFSQRDSRVFVGRHASEKTFKALAPTYKVIHLATHGVIDNRHPLYSHLLLTKTDPDNDGLLEAREIMDMTLRADMAALSACETANGQISPGEGVIGMSWAFFLAGTRSMLVSQWKVNSAGTSQLMINFYDALQSDQNHSHRRKATAMRNASLRAIGDHKYRHPFYWAAFALIGSNE